MPQFIRDFSLYNRRLKGLHTSLELPFCVNHTWMTKKKLQKGSVLICHHLQSPCDFSGSFAMLLRELGLRKGDKKWQKRPERSVNSSNERSSTVAPYSNTLAIYLQTLISLSCNSSLTYRHLIEITRPLRERICDMCNDSQCLWICNKIKKTWWVFNPFKYGWWALFPLSMSLIKSISKGILKGKEMKKKITLKLEFSRWQRQKLTPYTTMNYITECTRLFQTAGTSCMSKRY